MNLFHEYDIEEIILGLAKIIHKKRRLEEENVDLEEENQRLRDIIDRQYKMTQDQTAGILNALVQKCCESENSK